MECPLVLALAYNFLGTLATLGTWRFWHLGFTHTQTPFTTTTSLDTLSGASHKNVMICSDTRFLKVFCSYEVVLAGALASNCRDAANNS
jgi:hypothetical protein